MTKQQAIDFINTLPDDVTNISVFQFEYRPANQFGEGYQPMSIPLSTGFPVQLWEQPKEFQTFVMGT